ncbi:jerky-like protein [Trichonephila clavipes]|nr:jerky-like protein [Trichonephila clavipes]
MLMGRTIESSRCGRPSGLADFKVSTGWLKNFKSRHGIRELQIEGESLSGDNNSAHEFRKRFLQHVEGYCRDDVYNVDETGVNWKTAKKVIGFKTGVYSSRWSTTAELSIRHSSCRAVSSSITVAGGGKCEATAWPSILKIFNGIKVGRICWPRHTCNPLLSR